MSDVVAKVAIIGRVQLTPGILPVRLGGWRVECLVAHAFPATMEDARRGIKIDCSDCTVFTVIHRGRGDLDLSIITNVQEIFEQSLAAISEVSIWTKCKEVVGGMSSFLRQVGTTDVKAFFAQGASEEMVGWVNPSFALGRDAAGVIAGFLSNMIVSNGPAANPVPTISKRVMASLDLINLGFHTESFVNLFSLVDDLSQEVIKAGMTRRGLNEEEQKGLLRAIKEERLSVYLGNLAKLCGWTSLEEADEALFTDVRKVNSVRNKIMHGSRRLCRTEAIEASNVLLRLIDWLRSNPFEYTIPVLPRLRAAEAHFTLIPAKAETGGDQDSAKKQGDDRSA